MNRHIFSRTGTLFFKRIAVPASRIIVVIILLEFGLRLDLARLLSLQGIVNRFSAQQKSTYRIVCVGSSMLIGQSPYPFPRQLEAILNGANTGHTFSVINEGGAGNNSSYILKTLEQTLDRYDPKMVIAIMGIRNDEDIPEKEERKGTYSLVKHSRILGLLNSFWKGAMAPSPRRIDLADEMPREPFVQARKGMTLEMAVHLLDETSFSEIDRRYRRMINLTKNARKSARRNGKGADNGRHYIMAGQDNDRRAQESVVYKPSQGDNRLTLITRAKDGKLQVRHGYYPEAGDSRKYIKLGQFFIQQGNYPKAEASLERALSSGLEQSSLCDTGNLFQKLGNYSRARELYRAAISLEPHSVAGYLGLGQSYHKLMDFDAAEKAFKQAIEADPGDTRAHILLAQFYFQRTDYAGAEALYRKTVERGTTQTAAAYLGLGQLYHRTGNFSEAEKMFRKVLELEPKSFKAYEKLGQLYMDYGDYPRAEKLFIKTVESNPGSKSAVDQLTNFYQFMTKEKFYRECVLANPKDIRARINFGYLCFSFNNSWYYWQAERVFREALKTDPNNNDTRLGLASIYESRKDYPHALEMINEALRLNPFIDMTYNQAGIIYTKLGKYAAAETMLKTALEKNPAGYASYEGLAKLYLQTGKKEAAIRMLKEAMALRPDGTPSLRAMLAALVPGADERRNSDGAIAYSPDLIKNYRRLAEILAKRGIRLVCVQYPLRRVEPLREIFEDEDTIIFVDNYAAFNNVLKKDNYYELFLDSVHGDFGHLAQKGHTIMAENIARSLLEEVFN